MAPRVGRHGRAHHNADLDNHPASQLPRSPAGAVDGYSSHTSMSTFELYFSVPEIAQRLDVSSKWVRSRMQAGEFGADLVDVAGGLRVPLSGVLVFLQRHQIPASGVAAAVVDRLRPIPRRGFSESKGITARSEGELRCKLEASQ